jgi:hypothetical protein
MTLLSFPRTLRQLVQWDAPLHEWIIAGAILGTLVIDALLVAMLTLLVWSVFGIR